MENRPEDFLPSFESYGEFRSALKDSEENDNISQKRQSEISDLEEDVSDAEKDIDEE